MHKSVGCRHGLSWPIQEELWDSFNDCINPLLPLLRVREAMSGVDQSCQEAYKNLELVGP